MQYFCPDDAAQHALGLTGVDVPDYCARCRKPFMDHRNGQCAIDVSKYGMILLGRYRKPDRRLHAR